MMKHKPPKELEHWNQIGKPYKDQEIPDVAEFERMFKVWWSSLQPVSHVKNRCLLLATKEINWRKVNKAGPGGLVLVLLTLTWWKVACGGTSSIKWELVVEDVAAVLQQLPALPPIKEVRKHVSPDKPHPDSRPSKRISK